MKKPGWALLKLLALIFVLEPLLEVVFEGGNFILLRMSGYEVAVLLLTVSYLVVGTALFMSAVGLFIYLLLQRKWLSFGIYTTVLLAVNVLIYRSLGVNLLTLFVPDATHLWVSVIVRELPRYIYFAASLLAWFMILYDERGSLINLP